MRGTAISEICKRLKNEGLNMRKLSALEFFAREGDWQTKNYANEVGSLEAWEINPDFLPGLRRNIGNAKIKIVDSYKYGQNTKDRFNFIVIDNPQGIFGDINCYCEHFEALPIALQILKPHGFLIFNINWCPFNYNNFPEWKLRRNKFYGLEDSSCLSKEKFLLPFYKKYFEKYGFLTEKYFYQNRNNEYLAYAVFELKKT